MSAKHTDSLMISDPIKMVALFIKSSCGSDKTEKARKRAISLQNPNSSYSIKKRNREVLRTTSTLVSSLNRRQFHSKCLDTKLESISYLKEVEGQDPVITTLAYFILKILLIFRLQINMKEGVSFILRLGNLSFQFFSRVLSCFFQECKEHAPWKYSIIIVDKMEQFQEMDVPFFWRNF